jgi:hypothetical protein
MKEYFPGIGPLPGGLYPLDLSDPQQRKLCDLKTPRGNFVFEFNRLAANDPKDGLYFCTKCLDRFDSLNLLGTHVNQDHKETGKRQAEPDPEPEAEEAEPVNRRLPHCKGCGEPFANVRVLVAHKLECPGKVVEKELDLGTTEGVAQEEVAQGLPPA